ncbi:methyl-accepting chemotaxis protein [Roseateles asaccharophilus]|uniref:hypothetical protein n=1 Tax=Roseateles asaccharophilus TaxID=582607 RepID=UPI003832C4FF
MSQENTLSDQQQPAELQGLAKQAAEVMTAVREITEGGLGLNRPERHALRELRQTAEAIISSALDQAQRLVETADEVKKLARQGHLGQEG